jgi:hypothetical protein
MDQNDDSIFPEARHLNGTSEVGTTGSNGVTDAATSDRATEGVAAGLRPGFLAELALAMRATAEKERERIAARVADDASAHVEKVRARAAIETDELKRLAEEDVQHIEEWSASEMDRIRSEASRKIEDRRASLEEYLKQHDSIIDTEIDGVNAAVRDYSSTLDRYFEDLSKSEDPATIVARAEALPPAPDLDQVRAQARARAVAMFAEADEPRPAAEVEAVAAPGTMTPEPAPVADAMAEAPMAETDTRPSETIDTGFTPEAAIVADPTEAVDESPSVEAATPDGAAAITDSSAMIGEEAPSIPEGIAARPTIEAAEAVPIPVMDPGATAGSTWPVPEATPEPEREPVAASVDHTSAAVRLLRSVAPWTAPTHTGPTDRSESE